MEKREERASALSRRNFMTKAGIFVAGGVAGYGASLALPATAKASEPPPLPWKWTKLDPLEAGRRAYRSYLEKKG
ncbi:MAG: twin-arginine translocation signal domain-containing protein [Desulfoferrobacter sp.]